LALCLFHKVHSVSLYDHLKTVLFSRAEIGRAPD